MRASSGGAAAASPLPGGTSPGTTYSDLCDLRGGVVACRAYWLVGALAVTAALAAAGADQLRPAVVAERASGRGVAAAAAGAAHAGTTVARAISAAIAAAISSVRYGSSMRARSPGCVMNPASTMIAGIRVSRSTAIDR